MLPWGSSPGTAHAKLAGGFNPVPAHKLQFTRPFPAQKLHAPLMRPAPPHSLQLTLPFARHVWQRIVPTPSHTLHVPDTSLPKPMRWRSLPVPRHLGHTCLLVPLQSGHTIVPDPRQRRHSASPLPEH